MYVMPYQKHELHDSPDIRGRLPYCAPGPCSQFLFESELLI